MKVAETILTETRMVDREQTLTMPQGLLGFEEIKQYTIAANPGEEPFMWMRAQTKGVELAFILLSPFEVLPDYHPDIPND